MHNKAIVLWQYLGECWWNHKVLTCLRVTFCMSISACFPSHCPAIDRAPPPPQCHWGSTFQSYRCMYNFHKFWSHGENWNICPRFFLSNPNWEVGSNDKKPQLLQHTKEWVVLCVDRNKPPRSPSTDGPVLPALCLGFEWFVYLTSIVCAGTIIF